MTGLTNKRAGLTNKHSRANQKNKREKFTVEASKLQIYDSLYAYSYPQIDGKLNHYKFDGDLLFHLFGDDYTFNVTNCRVVQSPSSTLCRKHIMFAEVVLRKLSPVSFLKKGFWN